MSDWSPPVIVTAVSQPSRLALPLAMDGLLLGHWLAAFLSARLLDYSPHSSPWFPPAAVTLAGFLVLGWRALPALLVACLIATHLCSRKLR